MFPGAGLRVLGSNSEMEVPHNWHAKEFICFSGKHKTKSWYIYMVTGALKRLAKTSVFLETSSVILVFGSVPVTGLFLQGCTLKLNHWIFFFIYFIHKSKTIEKTRKSQKFLRGLARSIAKPLRKTEKPKKS